MIFKKGREKNIGKIKVVGIERQRKMNDEGRKNWDGLVEGSCYFCHFIENSVGRHCLI